MIDISFLNNVKNLHFFVLLDAAMALSIIITLEELIKCIYLLEITFSKK